MTTLDQLLQDISDEPTSAAELIALLSERIFASQESRNLQGASHESQVRWLVQGTPVTVDAAGTGRDTLGEGYFDTVNLVSGSGTANADNPRQIDITSGGFGSDCPDIFVDLDYTGTNGASVTNFFGDTVYLYNNVQGAVTQATTGPLNNLGFNRTILIHICAGAYFEDVTFPADMGSNTLHLVAEGTARRNNKAVMPRVQIGTGFTPSMTFNGSTNTSPGIKFTGISTLRGLQFNGGTDNVNICPSTEFEDCYINGGITLNGDTNRLILERTTVVSAIVDGAAAGGWRLECRDAQLLGGITVTGLGFAAKTNQIRMDDRTQVGAEILLQRTAAQGLNRWDVQLLGCALGSTSTVIPAVWVRSEGDGTLLAPFSVRIIDCPVSSTQMFGGEHWDVFVLESFAGAMPGVTILGNRIDPAVGNATTTVHGVSVQGAGSVEAAVILGNNWGNENLADTLRGVVTESGGTINNSVIADNAPASVTDSVTGGGNNTGGTGGASVADAFVTIGHPADLTGERALTAGNGVSVTDGGANGPVTVAVVPGEGITVSGGVVAQTGRIKQVYVSFGEYPLGNVA